MKPISCGVYFLYDKGELVYIGQSNNVYGRIGQHIREGKKRFDDFRIYETSDCVRLEGLLIGLLHPKYNRTEGNASGLVLERQDKFSSVIPPERILQIIHNFEEKLGKRITIREVAEENENWMRAYVETLMFKHMEEIPIFRIDDEWYMDQKWYAKNKGLLHAMIDQWADEEHRMHIERISG